MATRKQREIIRQRRMAFDRTVEANRKNADFHLLTNNGAGLNAGLDILHVQQRHTRVAAVILHHTVGDFIGIGLQNGLEFVPVAEHSETVSAAKDLGGAEIHGGGGVDIDLHRGLFLRICDIINNLLGFKHTIRDKVIGFGSHIQVANFLTQQTSSTYPIVIDQKTLKTIKDIPGVTHVQVTATKQGVGKTDSDFLGLVFKGVGPDFDTTFIHQNIVEGSIPAFSDKKNTGKLLVSKTQADKLGLKCGDRIFAYFIDDSGVRTRRFTIEGIYRTNLSQYDEVTCFTDIYTVRKLNAWEDDEATNAEIAVSDF